jgi:kinetochore protein Mis12/MTW1
MNETKKNAPMSATDLEIFETETEFFGFTPISFVDDVVNAINEYIYAAADSLQNYVENIDSGMPLSEIHQVSDRNQHVSCRILTTPSKGVDSILSMFETQVDKNFDKFELYVLRNIFKIPSGTIIPSYKVNRCVCVAVCMSLCGF